MRCIHGDARFLLVVVLLSLLPQVAASQQANEKHVDRARSMLDQIYSHLKKYYYDPSFRGLDLEKEYNETRTALLTADTDSELFSTIAQFLVNLGDSHTFFIPPAYREDIEYGFEFQFVGDRLFVTSVDSGGSAHRAQLRPGDEVLEFEGYAVTRELLPYIEYSYFVLAPRSPLRLTIRSPDSLRRTVAVPASATAGARKRKWHNSLTLQRAEDAVDSIRIANEHTYAELADSVFLWRMPAFVEEDPDLDKILDKARAYRTIVLDLRGNQGGSVETMLDLLRGFSRNEFVAATMKRRKSDQELRVEAARRPVGGKLILLVDSRSASAAEITARAVQQTKRGTVIGDRTAGSVMVSNLYVYKTGLTRFWLYGASYTVAELIMPDGERLEGKGVTPDEIVLATGEQIRDGIDPALERALELAGVQMTAVDATQRLRRLR